MELSAVVEGDGREPLIVLLDGKPQEEVRELNFLIMARPDSFSTRVRML